MKILFLIFSIVLTAVNVNAQQAVLDPAEAVSTDSVFQNVEVMPEFPGGNQAMMKFLSKNIKYPVLSAEQGIQGSVYISFIVSKEGKINNVQVVRGVETELDREAMRVIKMMPDWKPGLMDGKPVNVKFVLPIRFKLD